jgi:hypothetical protein
MHSGPGRVSLALLLLSLLFWASLASRLREPVEGVYWLRLWRRCQIELHTPPVQDSYTIIWACPGEDSLRVWPLPLQQPWYEKPIEPPKRPGEQEI